MMFRSLKCLLRTKLPGLCDRYWVVRRALIKLYYKLLALPRTLRFLTEIVRFLLESTKILIKMSSPLSARENRPGGNGNLIVMLVISEVWRDPRVEREARRLAGAGFRVKLLYPDGFTAAYGIPPLDWGPGIEFRPLPPDCGQFIYTLPYLFDGDFFSAACQEEAFAFHGHDLDTCLMALMAAQRTGAYCVCDFHEWYSENVSWNNKKNQFVPHPKVKRAVYRWAEKLLLRTADEIITVCDPLAVQMSEELYPRPDIHVIRNIPQLKAIDLNKPHPRSIQTIKHDMGKENMFWLLYQGGVGPSRMIEPIIEALRYAPSVFLAIRGGSIHIYGPKYEELAVSLGVADRLLCLPPVESSDVVPAAVGADAGVWTLPNLCKNFYYALPNKIFEYMASGLPVLAAHYPEARRIVEGYNVGLCFDPYDPVSIGEKLNFLVDNPTFRHQCGVNTVKALEDLRADAEWDKLVGVYRDLKKGKPNENSSRTSQYR